MSNEYRVIVTNDFEAEKTLREIKKLQDEQKRLLLTTQYMIQEYELKQNTINDEYARKIEVQKNMLMGYFENVEKTATKTQESYKLPSGKLKRKFGTNDYIKDDSALIDWMKANNRNELIQVKESPMWSKLKEEIQVVNGSVVTQDGEIIECIKIEKKPDTFVVEVD